MSRTVCQDSVLGGLYLKDAFWAGTLLKLARFIGSERQTWWFAWEEPHILEPLPLGTDLSKNVFRSRKSKWPRKLGLRDTEPDVACATIKVSFAFVNSE